jgi:hypothetical protein
VLTEYSLGRVSATRTETKVERETHMKELREVYNDLFLSIETRDALRAQTAARRWMDLIRERLASVVSASPTRSLEVQLQGAG